MPIKNDLGYIIYRIFHQLCEKRLLGFASFERSSDFHFLAQPASES